MDALLTQRALAEQIEQQRSYYLMVVKRNQPRLYEVLTLFFELPASSADQEQSDRVQTITKGHGRLEMRTLECKDTACSSETALATSFSEQLGR